MTEGAKRVNAKSARFVGFGLLALWGAGGCASKPPQPVSPTSAPEVAAAVPAETATPIETAPAAAPTKPVPRVDTTVIIDPGSSEEGSVTSLAAAARAERERRARASRPVAVITNQTLAGSKGGLTSAEPGPPVAGGEASPKVPARETASENLARDESYWRSRALDLRLAWRRAFDDIERLEQSAEHFRRRFYAEDDPYVRDGQVKPAWDRALDQLRQARDDAEASKAELEAFLEEGRRAGALPGWLREGVEHEPEPLPEEPPPGEPREPRVLDEEPS